MRIEVLQLPTRGFQFVYSLNRLNPFQGKHNIENVSTKPFTRGNIRAELVHHQFHKIYSLRFVLPILFTFFFLVPLSLHLHFGLFPVVKCLREHETRIKQKTTKLYRCLEVYIDDMITKMKDIHARKNSETLESLLRYTHNHSILNASEMNRARDREQRQVEAG